ncbi:MAG TPA: hypothetical protein VF669_02375 [Tepidisphaeraceae bacterium]|jgi:hypothetical protein
MFKRMAVAVVGGAMVLGCAPDKPHEYGKERPPVGELDSRDRGLQSKDVVQASDQMAQDLLKDSELNASKDRWLMVVEHVENRTTDRAFDMDIFLERLRVNLARYGKGRVQLVENRVKLRDLQNRELDSERDMGGAAPRPRVQPDYGLYAKIMELPNRGTSYYLAEFTVTDLRNGLQTWTNAYEVKVAR